MKKWMNNRAKLAGEYHASDLSEKAREYVNGASASLYAYEVEHVELDADGEEVYVPEWRFAYADSSLDIYFEDYTLEQADACLTEWQEEAEQQLAEWEEEEEDEE